MDKTVPTPFDEPLDKFRFAVERDGQFSQMWFMHVRGSDVYLGALPTQGAVKVTLHASRECHVKAHEPSGETILSRWRRAATPADGAVHVLSVDFPTDLTFRWGPMRRLRPNRKALTISAAPPGHSVEFALFYSREPPTTLEPKLAGFGTPSISADMPSGEYVSVVVRHGRPFDPARVPLDGRTMAGTIPVLAPGQALENASMVAWSEPKDGRPMWLTNVQGLTVRRPK